MPNKKAQIWGIDLIVGIFIFLMGLIILFFYAVNLKGNTGDIEDISLVGDTISENLLSEGTPIDWTEENVIFPGLLSQNKVNETKLQMFYNLNQDYPNFKGILKTKYDFYIYFSEQMDIEGEQVDGIGKPNVNRNNIIEQENPKNIFKTTRVTAYNNKPVTLNIYLWN